MKERNRIFALLLAVMMVVTYMPSMAFAAASDESEPAAATEIQEDAVTEEAVQEEPADAEVQTEEPEAQEEAEAAGETPAKGEEPEALEEESETDEETVPANEEASLPKTILGKIEPAAPAKMTPEAEIAGNDELLEQFFESEVDKALGKKTSDGKLRARKSPRRNNLNYTEQYIYDEILANMQDVATGNASSAEFNINLRDELEGYLVETGISNYPWAITYESLGLESATGVYIPYEYEDESGETQEYWDLSGEAKEILFNIDKVVNALLADQPYYAYWFDKTQGYSSGLNAGLDTDDGAGSDAYFENDPILTISFTVASGYRAGGGDQYNIDQEKAASTVSAVETVEQIVEQNAEASDVDKLYAYKDAICDMTSYNDEAAAGGVEYGDPWQLIWVFDGDDETNVVCEGYSKAFQFLCDKSSFIDSRIECHTVTGTMDGGTGAGNHMWNILRMDDGENYIADITNCDEGSVGYPEALFLKGYDSRPDDGYTYSGVHYVYDNETLEMYGRYTDLYMASSDYRKVEWISFNPVNGPMQLIEGLEGEMVYEDEGEAYFKYEFPGWPNFENGDELTVKYTDNDEALTYQYYGYDEEAGEMSFSRFDGDKWDVINSSDLSYYTNQDGPWEVGGEGYTFTLMYCGATADYPVELNENPDFDKGFSFEPAEPISLVEKASGDYQKEQVWNEETGEYENVEYFRYSYYNLLYKEGNVITLDGVSYTYEHNEDGSVGYYNSDGERLDTNGLYYFDNQSYENQWTQENQGTITIVFGDKSCTVPVTIIENPVQSISFEPVELINIIENTNGYIDRTQILNEETGQYEDVEYYWYYYYNFIRREGDKITVNEDVYTYGYNDDEDNWGFYNSDGEELDSEYLEFSNDQSYENQWTVDNQGTITVTYMGHECTVPVTIIESPVQSISFEPAKPIEIVENTHGYNTGGYVLNPETQESEYVQYYRYDVEGYLYNPDNIITVNGDVYTYKYDEERDDYRFLNSEGDALDPNYLSLSSDQSAENQWTVDNPGTVTIKYMGKSCDTTVTIVENPVHSISYKPVKPIEIIENTHGYTTQTSIWNPDTQEDEEVEYYTYETYEYFYRTGDILIVNDIEYTYGSNDEGESGFYNSEGERISTDDISRDAYQSYNNRWTVENPGAVTITYMGHSYAVPVTIIENPVHSISFETAEPITIIENTNGSFTEEYVLNPDTEEGEYKEYFKYNTRKIKNLSKEGNKITVNDEVYTYGYPDEDSDGGFFNSKGEQLENVDLLSYSAGKQSYKNQWTVDNPGKIIVTYMGVKCEVPVYITESPVHSISFEPSETAKLIEGVDGYEEWSYVWDPDTDEEERVDWFRYDTSDYFYTEGNKIIINDEAYTYGYISGKGNRFFNSEGEALDENYLNYSDNQSYENPWSLDNPGTLKITYMGKSCEVPVTITENPITDLTYIPVHEYADLIFEVEGEWEEESEDGEASIFIYDRPEFEDGDKFVISYSDRDDLTYVYSSSNSRFVNVNDSKDMIRSWDLSVKNHQESEWGITGENEYHETTITYQNRTTAGRKIRIVPNPIESIAFSRNGENRIELIDGKDSDTEWWDTEDDEIEYKYFDVWYQEGDTLTITKTNGDTSVYEYRYIEQGRYRYLAFVNVDDETDILKGDYLGFRSNPSQSPDNEWQVGGKYAAEASYMGVTTDVEVRIVKNPVTEVSVEFADGSTTAKVIENIDGQRDWYWDEETDDEIEFFCYEFPGFSVGDSLLVTKNGGINKYEFKEGIYNGKYFTDGFVNINNDKDVIYENEVETWRSNQGGSCLWVLNKPEDEDYYFEFEYFGFRFQVPAEVVENPVSAINFSREGYAAGQTIELTEGIDARINSDGGSNRWFEYFLTFKDGDTIKITDPKGNTSDYNAVPYNEEWDDEAKWFENAEGDRIKPYKIEQGSDQSFTKQWKPGDGDHEITLEYFTRTTGVNVKIIANQVQKLSFVRPGSDAVELYENGDGSWADNKFYYQIKFKPGDELYVTYLNEANPVKYVAADNGNGRVETFQAEGSVPEGAEKAISVYNLGFRHNSSNKLQYQIEEGETPTMMLMYKGMWTDVPVKIVENPVESFEYVWKEGGDRVELTEGKDGYEVTYTDDNYVMFEYAIPFADGDILKVKYTGTADPVEYIFNRGDNEDSGVFSASGTVPAGAPKAIGEYEIYQISEQHRYNQWTVGNNYEMTLEYMGHKLNVPVVIVADVDPGHTHVEGSPVRENEVAATCKAEGGYDEVVYCTECGKELSRVHKTIAKLAHTEEVIPAVAATCTTTGLTAGKKCSVCGEIIVAQEVIPALNHTWDAGVITKDATETEEGSKLYTCTVCGATKTEVIPVIGHVHVEGAPVRENEVPATCKAEGSYDEVVYCTDCGNEISREHKTIAKLAHTEEVIPAVAATCTATGLTAGKKCSVCGEILEAREVIPIDANAHAYGSWQKHDTEQHKRVCANDASHVEYAAHAWDDGKVTKEATETEEGSKTYTCTVCGQTKVEIIPVIAHTHTPGAAVIENEKAATCTAEGTYDEVTYCTKCNKEVSRVHKTVEKLGHSWSAATYKWNADYTEVTGTRTCNACNEKQTATAKRAKSDVIKQATSSEKGLIKYTSEAFAAEGFAVQTATVETELSAEEKAIAQALDEANNQTNDASGKANAAENSTDEGVVSTAEDATAKAAELAAKAEAAAEKALDSAEAAYINALNSGDAAQIETAKNNLEVAIDNLVTAKVIKAAASSSVAKAKQAAAKVAANKAAAASAAAQKAADPTAAEELRKEAEAYAAQAEEKAAAAEKASADASQAVADLEKIANNADPAVKAAASSSVAKGKAAAEKSAGAASESAQAAETSSEAAKASETKAEEAVEEIKRQGVLDKKIPKMTIKSRTSKKTSITIKWKWTSSGKKKLKKSKATKYEIWVCPNTKFAKKDTIVKTCSKSKTSYTVKGLKKNKKYYFKIRAIKYVKGVKHVGPWSSRKYIKTKKK